MDGIPGVVQSAADMPIGETECYRVEVSDDDDRMRAGFYLFADHLCLFVAKRDGAAPFDVDEVHAFQVSGRETIGLQMIVD